MEPSLVALSTTPAAELVRSLQQKIDTVLHPLFPTDRPLALVDFPVYANVGDSLIWLGALASLRRHGFRTLRYVCSHKTYSRAQLARSIGDGTILISGGGNFGDRYEPHQTLREDVIASFPTHRIIQLPQSIWFQSSESLERARRVICGHRQLTLLLRDTTSLEFAAREFAAVPRLLCPDMALALGPLAQSRPASDRIVWLSRTDSESASSTPLSAPAGVERVDWVRSAGTPIESLLERVHRRIRSHPEVMRWLYGPIARARARRGIRMLSGARAVISDRLHGHILCMLLGIPHFLLPNTNGKVRAFYETWTRSSPLVRWCESESEALSRALAERSQLHP